MNLKMAGHLEHGNHHHLPLAARNPFQDTVAVLPLAQNWFMLVIAMITASFDWKQNSVAQSLQSSGSL